MRASIAVFALFATATGIPTTHLPRPRQARKPCLDSRNAVVTTLPTYQPQLHSAIRKDGNAPMLVLVVSCAALIAAASISMLAFASLPHQSIPLRNLVAAAAVAVASTLLEALVGHPRRSTFVGRIISEVGQALAIAAAGWIAFSVFWAAGFGSLLTPGRKPILNAGAVLGCTAAAVVYGHVRPASRAQTATPFAASLVMLHLHLLITAPDIETLKLAPMAVASAVLSLLAIGVDTLVQRAVDAPAAPSAPARYLRHVRGTADMVLASLVVNVIWTFFTLCKWTSQEAPSWGFVTIAASLSATELGMRAAFDAVPATAQRARAYYVGTAATYYRLLAYWLADLCAWRTLWPDTPYDTDSYVLAPSLAFPHLPPPSHT